MANSFGANAAGAGAELNQNWTAWGATWTGTLDVVWAVASSQERLRQWMEEFGLLAPLAYFVIEAAQVIVSPLPGGLLPAAGALAFGPWVTLALSLGGCAAGSTVVFALARRWGRPLVRRLLKPQTVERYAGVLGARGGLWLFVVVAIPVLPGDAVCALASLSSISFRRFIAASTLARVPSTALTIILAAELSTAPAWATPVAALAIVVLFAVAFTNRSRIEAWVLGFA